MSGRVYELETVNFLCDNAAGDIVHAGTFFGDFLPALSRSYDRVWAFEPNPDSFKCAEITTRLNDLRNVILENAGLGRKREMATLTTERNGEYLGGASFVTDERGETRIDPLDAVLPSDRRIGMIQLDVEGYEHAALDGARETIARWNPILVVETVPPILADLGYSEAAKINGNQVFRRAR